MYGTDLKVTEGEKGSIMGHNVGPVPIISALLNLRQPDITPLTHEFLTWSLLILNFDAYSVAKYM